MNSIAFTRASSLILSFWLLLGFAAPCFSDGLGQAHRLSVFSRTEKSSFEKTDLSLIRLQSSQACNIEFIWSAGQTAEFTWTIEAFISPLKTLRHSVDSPLNIIISRESRAVTVRLVAEGNHLERQDEPSAAGPGRVSLLDPATGLLWQVRIQARLPLGIDIDTTQFEGWTHFAHEPALGDHQGAPGLTPDVEEGNRALKSAEELMRQQNESETLKRYQELLRNRKIVPKR